MPKIISLGTITVSSLRMRNIAFHLRPVPGTGCECVITYELLRDDGTIHEIKHIGNYEVPGALQKAIEDWMAQVAATCREAEGI